MEILKGEEPCCPVCMEDYEPGDKLRVLPCSHAFHVLGGADSVVY